MESLHYKIVIAHSEDFGGVVYHAQNKSTGVLEVPFRILSDASIVLSDLEQHHSDSFDNLDNVTELKEVH